MDGMALCPISTRHTAVREVPSRFVLADLPLRQPPRQIPRVVCFLPHTLSAHNPHLMYRAAVGPKRSRRLVACNSLKTFGGRKEKASPRTALPPSLPTTDPKSDVHRCTLGVTPALSRGRGKWTKCGLPVQRRVSWMSPSLPCPPPLITRRWRHQHRLQAMEVLLEEEKAEAWRKVQAVEARRGCLEWSGFPLRQAKGTEFQTGILTRVTTSLTS